MKARSGIAQAAALVTVLTAFSAILGFVRDVVIAGVFGAGAQLDAYLVAQGLMNLVLAMVAGAMAKATVPVLAAQTSTDENSNKAAHTLSVVLTVTLLVLGLGSLIMALAANTVVTVLAPGFKGAQEELAASLTRIVLIATVLISGTNLLAAAAEAHRRFFWSAMQGVPFNLIMIAAAVLFGPRYGVYAWRVISLGETLLVASLLTALYPAFGAAAGTRDLEEMRRLVGRGLSTVATVLMPVWGFLIVCAVPLVALLFEHGSFTPADTQRTATAMLWYAPALLALGWREMVVRASYALGDSRRPVLVFVFAMSINVVGDFTLGLTFGIAGLAASTSLSVVFAAVANTLMLGRRHDAVDLRSLPVMVGRTALAAAAGTAVGALVYRLLGPVVGTGLISELLLVASVGSTLLGVFIGVLYLLRAPERRLLTEAIDVVARRRR